MYLEFYIVSLDGKFASSHESLNYGAYFQVLPHPAYNHKTYFSENALLPGLVTGAFDEQNSAAR